METDFENIDPIKGDSLRMEKQELISVIVPVFNTAKYLTSCLESLMHQSYENLEIILVNDGSTDNSGNICKEYSKKDSRFILIEQKNKGLGMARNIGLEKARGQYVCFVDSDDFVHEKYVEILYRNLLSHDADISMCGYEKIYGEQKTGNSINNVCSVLSRYQMLYDITTTGPQNCSEKIVVCWNKLIRMDIMKRLKFTDRLHEDEFMINDILLNIKTAVWSDARLYFYRQHSESITGLKNRMDNRHLDVLDAVYDRIILFSQAEYKNVFYNMLCSFFENSAYIYYSLLSSGNKLQLVKKIYPRYLVVLLKYSDKMTKKQFLHHLLFLISPEYYRRKYKF